MTEVTISSQAETFCPDFARQQIEGAIDAASWPDDSCQLHVSGDSIAMLVRTIDLQLLNRGVQPNNLEGTLVTYRPATSERETDDEYFGLRFDFRRAVDGWLLSSVEQVQCAGGMPMQCEIDLTPEALADTTQGHAA